MLATDRAVFYLPGSLFTGFFIYRALYLQGSLCTGHVKSFVSTAGPIDSAFNGVDT